ncbi:FecCD family ABC transporter permease [Nocardioides yefusunii]|uniref:FecCD family ABC transporter permease n=1 Tax=Nocardioides yefusunii TaxID=2500546 RepID=A0ABW1QZD1_9ACTN|nr:iron ABC transporter permease [Nocardioides yefusunii]
MSLQLPLAPTAGNRRGVLLVLAAVLAVCMVIGAGTGQLEIPAGEVLGSIWHKIGLDWGTVPTHPQGDSTLWNVRFPRLLMAALVGAALATAGAVMQGVFGNPLAEPGTVGVSSGAAVVAAATIVFGWDFFGEWTVAIGAFVGGLLTTVLVYLMARSNGRTEVVTLVLTGVAVNAMAGGALAFLMFAGDTSSREEIIFWQMGSLNGARTAQLWVVVPVVLVGLVASCLIARKLDLLALGDKSARHVGVDVDRLRGVAIVVVAVLTAGAVAFAGIIAFVGLIVPHLLRMVVGPGHRALVPASALGGALLLVLADQFARNAIAYADLPIGMVTSLVGGPIFFWLLRGARRSAGGWA